MNILDIDEINRTKELNFNRYDVLFVSEQLKLIEKTLGGGIPYPYNVNIFSHLYIMISRSRKTNYQIKEIELSTEQLQSLDHESPIYEMANRDPKRGTLSRYSLTDERSLLFVSISGILTDGKNNAKETGFSR